VGSHRLQDGRGQHAVGSVTASRIRVSWISAKDKAGPQRTIGSFGSPAFSGGVGETRCFLPTPHSVFSFSGTRTLTKAFEGSIVRWFGGFESSGRSLMARSPAALPPLSQPPFIYPQITQISPIQNRAAG